jgi:predicted Zn-dependent protease
VLRAEPKHVEALNLLGVVLGRLGRNAEAVASFDRALTAAPGSIDAWYGRGMTLVAMNRPQQAIKKLRAGARRQARFFAGAFAPGEAAHGHGPPRRRAEGTRVLSQLGTNSTAERNLRAKLHGAESRRII